LYRARDTRLDRMVAIKVLPAHLADKPELRGRFECEARTVASLNHPHICTLYDIGRQDGIDFLVMEYLEGETLAMRLIKGPAGGCRLEHPRATPGQRHSHRRSHAENRNALPRLPRSSTTARCSARTLPHDCRGCGPYGYADR